MSGPRIVSLLPAATEMVCALGLESQLVGRSHECAYPDAALEKPVVMRGVVDTAAMTEAEIDAEVTRRLRAGEPLYEIDSALLEALSPDLLITQELCEVCAASPKDLAVVLTQMARPPTVLQLTPKSLAAVLENIATLGAATGRSAEASALIAGLEARIAAVKARADGARGRRVFCLEWLDPLYCSGHWVPEMVELAGGDDALGRRGTDSVRIGWEEVLAWAPEVLIVAPCGYGLDAVVRHAAMLPTLPGWSELPAVREARVFAVDADAYLARPGPRLIDGLEMLAHLIHPERFGWTGAAGAFEPLRTKTCEACGDAFMCRTASGCWCEEVDLPPGRAAALSGCYDDCLCPACLEPAAARARSPA